MEIINRLEEALPNLYVYGELGRGGLAIVYGALVQDSEESRAIKVYADTKHYKETGELRPNGTTLSELEYATKHSRVFRTPGLVPVYETGTIKTKNGELPYVVMEKVEGTNFDEVIDRNNSQKGYLKKVRRFMRAGGRAIKKLHDSGLIHGDLKPSAVLESGRKIKVIDYDTVAPSPQKTEWVTGSIPYMAREQYCGAETSTAADVSQWTSTFYAALCQGSTPLRDATKKRTGCTDQECSQHLMLETLKIGFEPKLPEWVHTAGDNQINKILRQGLGEPSKRPSISELTDMIDKALDMTITLQGMTDQNWSVR